MWVAGPQAHAGSGTRASHARATRVGPRTFTWPTRASAIAWERRFVLEGRGQLVHLQGLVELRLGWGLLSPQGSGAFPDAPHGSGGVQEDVLRLALDHLHERVEFLDALLHAVRGLVQ